MDKFDGIEEQDNPMPNWWLWTLYFTIIFAVFYFLYYVVLEGPSLRSIYDKDVQGVLLAQGSSQSKTLKPTDQLFAAMLMDSVALSKGKDIYLGKCAACHLPDGGGSIGPNLTDRYWIHGDGKPGAIFDVVAQGVSDKGMPPWASLLTPDEMKFVVTFVTSLKGKSPAVPKAPQGTEVKE
jgi:cytochrome c oxidase cbb3-type subunit 3